MYLAFFVKMHTKTREQHIRGNEQRRYLRSLSRQALFIAEYIQIKYPGLYNEAACFFNAINTTYPTKPELRKTKEFREWKASMSGEEPKRRKRPIQQYLYVQTTPEPESPQPLSSNEPESPWPQPSDECESPQPQASFEFETQQSPESPQASFDPESPQASNEPENPQTPAEELTRYNDNMVLRIHMLEPPQKPPPTVTTQTIETVTTQEILEPLTLDNIPPERIDELMAELRQDPDIQNMFSDIEAQLAFEQLGMDIDIPELNLLEDELVDW